MKENILLINPSEYDSNGKLIKKSKEYIPCNTLYHIAAFFPETFTISIVDEVVDEIDFSENYGLIGITVNTLNARRAYDLCQIFKENHPKSVIVLGGIHPSYNQEEASNFAHTIVVGESENIFPELIDDYLNDTLKKIYKSDASVDLNAMPVPRYDLLAADKYIKLPGFKCPLIPVQTARGCPFRCDFCIVHNYLGSKIRYKSVEKVVEEIKLSGYRSFFFTDDNFFGNPKRAKELMTALIPLKIRYQCQSDTTIYRNPELLKLAQKSGCKVVYLGLETINTDNLKTVNKTHNKPSEYRTLFKMLRKHKINAFSSLIIGLGNETKSGMDKTVKFLIKNKSELSALYVIAPMPGTKTYQELLSSGRFVEGREKWWLNHKRDNILKDDPYLFSLQKEALRQLYSYSSIFRRFFPFYPYKMGTLLINLYLRKNIKKYDGFSL